MFSRQPITKEVGTIKSALTASLKSVDEKGSISSDDTMSMSSSDSVEIPSIQRPISNRVSDEEIEALKNRHVPSDTIIPPEYRSYKYLHPTKFTTSPRSSTKIKDPWKEGRQFDEEYYKLKTKNGGKTRKPRRKTNRRKKSKRVSHKRRIH
jgi:hypothetical protein